MEPVAYVADASGFAAYILVVLAVVVGLVLSIRQASAAGRGTPANDRLHQYLLLGAALFTAVHGLGEWLNPLVGLSLGAVVVPFQSAAQSVWVALGILAGYAGLVVMISGWIRPLIGFGWWRRLHYLAFVVFVLATLHGLGMRAAGETGWALWIYGVSTALVVGLVLVRIFQGSRRAFEARARWAAAILLIAAAGAVWAIQSPVPSLNALTGNPFGPQNPGTPVRLATPPVSPPFPSGAFSAPFSGTVQTRAAAGGMEVLVLTAHFTARVSGAFVVRLTGSPLADGGLDVKLSSVTMGPVQDEGQFHGTVTAISASRLSAVVVDSHNHHVYRLLATLRPAASGTHVSGTINAAPSS